MLDANELTKFYLLSCLALVLAMWAFDLFSLRSYPFALPLLFAAFFLNPLLVRMGERIVGDRESALKVVTACAFLAFIIVWVSNPAQGFESAVAIPATVMFVMPGALYFIRELVLGSESNVQPQ